MAAVAGPSSLRAKLYELIDNQAWQDKGTGYCSCPFIESIQDYCLVVRSEEDDSILLSTPVLKEGFYQKQQSTLIVWTERNGSDLALSFQDSNGCGEIWEKIYEIQLQHKHDGRDSPIWLTPTNFEMPAPSLAALDNILEILRQASCTPFRRDLTITYIRITKYLDRLIPIFEASEDLESTDDLYKLCRIAKYMVLLADDDFFTHIIGDDIIIPFSGMFEHDPDFPNSHPQYRQYLSDPSRFKEVIPINDEAITLKIHYVFRLQYLKDVVLARMLDDNVTQLLNSKIFVYNLDIVTAIESNVDFLGQLVALISDPDAEELRKHNVVLFLHQYCTIAKSLQALVRSNVYRKLAQNGLFTVLEYALTCTLDRVRLAGCELIMTIAEFDKLLLRSYILAQSKQSVRPLIDILVNQFTTDKAPGVQMQCYEILRILLDVQVPAGSDAMQSALIEGRGGNGNDQAPSVSLDSETEQFLSIFYDSHMAKAMEPLEQLKPLAVAELRTSAQAPCQLYSLVCELATFCVRQHSFRSRYYILSGQLAEKIVLLLKAPVKHLQLVALRFIRACVGLTDNFVNRFLLRRGLLVPIVDLFLQYKHRYNLINSACLELFDFITAKNQKPLIAYLIQNHGQMLSEGVTYSDAIQRLAAQHNRNKSMQATNASTGPTATNPTDDKVQAKRPRSQTADDGMAGRPGRGGMLFQTAQVSGSVLLKRHKLSRKPPTGGRSQFGSWSTDTVDDDESAYFESTDDDDPPLLPKAATAPASPMLSASPSEPSHPTLPLRRVASKDSGGLLADTTLTGAESEENESEADRRVDEDDNSCSEFLPMSRFSKATNDPDGRPVFTRGTPRGKPTIQFGKLVGQGNHSGSSGSGQHRPSRLVLRSRTMLGRPSITLGRKTQQLQPSPTKDPRSARSPSATTVFQPFSNDKDMKGDDLDKGHQRLNEKARSANDQASNPHALSHAKDDVFPDTDPPVISLSSPNPANGPLLNRRRLNAKAPPSTSAATESSSGPAAAALGTDALPTDEKLDSMPRQGDVSQLASLPAEKKLLGSECAAASAANPSVNVSKVTPSSSLGTDQSTGNNGSDGPLSAQPLAEAKPASPQPTSQPLEQGKGALTPKNHSAGPAMNVPLTETPSPS